MNVNISTKGKKITATTSSVAHLLEPDERALQCTDILFYNPGPNRVHVITGASTGKTADEDCAVLPPGKLVSYRKAPSETHVYVLAITGNQDIFAMLGEGQAF